MLLVCLSPLLQFTLYNEILAKEWDKINAMGKACGTSK